MNTVRQRQAHTGNRTSKHSPHSHPFTRVSCISHSLTVCSQLDNPEINGSLVCVMAEAAAKALEHTLLLSLLLPAKNFDVAAFLKAAQKPPAPQTSKSSPSTPSPSEPLPAYRYGHTQGYEVLPAARTKSGETRTCVPTTSPLIPYTLCSTHKDTHVYTHILTSDIAISPSLICSWSLPPIQSSGRCHAQLPRAPVHLKLRGEMLAHTLSICLCFILSLLSHTHTDTHSLKQTPIHRPPSAKQAQHSHSPCLRRMHACSS